MSDDRSQADRILVAQLTGEARHRAKWRDMTEAEEAAAVGELQALAGGRADLLAEVAGLFEGASEGEPDELLARSAAALCRKAGADPEAVPAWIEEGRRRRSAARQPPFSGGLHGGGAGGPRPGEGLRPVRPGALPVPRLRIFGRAAFIVETLTLTRATMSPGMMSRGHPAHRPGLVGLIIAAREDPSPVVACPAHHRRCQHQAGTDRPGAEPHRIGGRRPRGLWRGRSAPAGKPSAGQT